MMSEETEKAEGLRASLHGSVYQIKLLMLYMWRSLKKKYHFELSSEVKMAEKFDDIVLQYTTGKEDPGYFRFVQAKHKQDETTKISYGNLLNVKNGDFSLRKYFRSYRRIIEKLKPNKRKMVKEFIICTNIDFDEKPETQNIVKVIERNDPIMDGVAPYMEKCAKYCKIHLTMDDELYQILMTSNDAILLSDKLAELINISAKITLRPELIKTYQKWIVDNVIDRRSRMFKKDIANTAFGRELLWKINDKDILNKKLVVADSVFKNTETNSKELTDKVDEKEISDFLENLIFAVNQPNETILGDIINNEMGEKFNLLQADVITDIFFRDMLNWLKKKQGTEHTNKTGDNLFKSIEKKISLLLRANIDFIFTEKLKSTFAKSRTVFARRNELISEFLNGSLNILNFVCTNLFLGSLEIYHNLNYSSYIATDSRIFVDMKTIVDISNILPIIENMFKSNGVYNLVIIQCNVFTKEHIHIIRKLLQTAKDVNSKKVILVSTEPLQLQKYLYKVAESFIHFSHLTRATQKTIKSRTISFQGSKIEIDDLLQSENIDRIDGNLLVDLLLNNEINIGRKLVAGDDSYIPRTFHQRSAINEDVLKKNIHISDNIIVSGAEDNLDLIVTNPKMELLTDAEWSEDKFIKEDRRIHWLKLNEKQLIWHRSNCSLKELIHLRTNFLTSKNEDELLYEKFCIISDIAGMGKSTVLKSLAKKIKEKNKKHWVAIIDLNIKECQTALNENKNQDFNRNMVVDFLSNSLLHLGKDYAFEKYLFEFSLENKTETPVTLLVDGFDEICPDYEKVVTKFLQGLKELEVPNVFVTTRPHMKDALEISLGVFAYTLEPFPQKHQKKFLTNFFQNKLTDGIVDKKRLATYIDALVNKVSYSIKDKEIQFIGVPLHIKMLAEIFLDKTPGGSEWESCKEFLSSSGPDPKLPDSLGLINLYEMFYDKKIHNYTYNKSNETHDSVNKTAALKSMINRLLKFQEKVSLQLFFNKEEISELQGKLEDIDEYEKGQLPKIGFIIHLGDDQSNPEFTHRTFAEYFAARFLIGVLKRPNSKTNRILFTKVLLNIDFNMIRSFLSSFFKLPNCLQTKTEDSYLAYLWKEEPHSICNEHNQSILHIVAEEGNINLIDFILSSLNGNQDARNGIVHLEDSDGQSAIYAAVKSGCMDTIKKLYDSNARVRDRLGRNILYVAAYNRHWKVVQWLIQQTPVEVIDINVKRVFHFAAISGEQDVVELLLQHLLLFDKYYIKKCGVLAHIIKHGQLNILKWLLENKYISITGEDDCASLLYDAFEYNKSEVVEYLLSVIDNGFDFICKRIAAEYNQSNLLKRLRCQ